jgi:hypothetical protein
VACSVHGRRCIRQPTSWICKEGCHFEVCAACIKNPPPNGFISWGRLAVSSRCRQRFASKSSSNDESLDFDVRAAEQRASQDWEMRPALNDSSAAGTKGSGKPCLSTRGNPWSGYEGKGGVPLPQLDRHLSYESRAALQGFAATSETVADMATAE